MAHAGIEVIEVVAISAGVVAGLVVVVLGWRVTYGLGLKHGRLDQATETRREVERAVIAKAHAEQLAETWERRARAMLRAHFGPDRKP